ncbi:oligosaccharide flippase family protein [Zoogloea dura]|uniref:Oligosaccharide flippase family protein n=1 Tax=Zoogloea dura TaxID=2728840 RepID=A0A848GDE6_9RHOO|nr:oligosaccharide flippase family protein [Zoogloea dura]NML29122.1 oligosaccharide flippase family protein [Zoogloea dura]
MSDSNAKSLVTVVKLVLAMGGGAGLVFLNQLILAKYLDVESYGLLSSSLAILNVLSPIAGYGIGGLWLRLSAKRVKVRPHTVKASLLIALASSCIAVLVAVFLAVCTKGPYSLEAIVVFILLPVMFNQASLALMTSVAQSVRRYSDVGLAQMAPHVGRLVSGGVGAGLLSSLYVTAWGYALTAFIVFVYQIFYVVKWVGVEWGEIRAKVVSPRYFKRVLRASTPYALNLIFSFALVQIPVYLASVKFGNYYSGQFAICVAILQLLYIVPNAVFGQYLLPVFHRMARGDRNGLVRMYRKSALYVVAVAAVLAVAVAVIVPKVISHAFGEKYGLAADYLPVLVLAVPLRSWSTAVGAVLLAVNETKGKLIAMLLAVFAQVGFILYPLSQAALPVIVGSVVAAEVTLLVAYIVVASRKLGVRSIFLAKNCG